MYALSAEQTKDASGGLLWTTPAIVALADTACLGPLAWSFGVGFGIGTLLYNAFSD